MKKIEYKTPPPELVDAYLKEIARGYGLDWSPPGANDDDSGGGGGLKVIRKPCFHSQGRIS